MIQYWSLSQSATHQINSVQYSINLSNIIFIFLLTDGAQSNFNKPPLQNSGTTQQDHRMQVLGIKTIY